MRRLICAALAAAALLLAARRGERRADRRRHRGAEPGDLPGSRVAAAQGARRPLHRRLGRAARAVGEGGGRRLPRGGARRRRARPARLQPLALAEALAPQVPAVAEPPAARVPRASARTTRGSSSYLTWNEANHRGQPTWNRPDIVARYYDMLRRNCRSCTIVGPAVLDTLAMPKWVKRGRAPHAVHESASGRCTTTSTRTASGPAARARCSNATKPRTRRSGSRRPAGWCARDNGSRIEFADSKQARGPGDAPGRASSPA